MPVHVVVLAAGRGSRLSEGTETPKWLLDVADRKLAERHLEGIEAAADEGAVASASVVVGHEAAAIEAFAADRGGLRIIRKPEFASLNNWCGSTASVAPAFVPSFTISVNAAFAAFGTGALR